MRPRTPLAAAIGAILLGCATPPKPPELEALEKLRADPAAAAAAKRAPDLVGNADSWLARARKDWQDNDLEDAAHKALMGQIKLKQAIALTEQDRAKSRMATADAEVERAQDEHARLQKDLAALNEQIALLQRLREQSDERRRLEEQLAVEKTKIETERQKAIAIEKLSEAELALKTADTVNASRHAQVPYQAARDLVARAQQELGQSQFQAAQISAEMAKRKADEAAEAAKPAYRQEAESAENRARAEALARDAAALPRVTLRRDSRGSLQRLVLPIPAESLFDRRNTNIAPGRDAILDDIAALIKKYPNYPIQVVGFTDSRGRSNELLALSLARAQAVYSALLVRGVEAKRMVVSGQGGAEPISDNRTATGRSQNNRVEIIFLYQ